jgi:tyrosine-protein kinase Etk/Wzc
MRYEMDEARAEQAAAENDEKVDLLRVVALFAAEWRTGLIAALVAFVIAAVAIERIPAQYEATAVILPKDGGGGGGGGSSLAALFTGIKPSNNYLSLLWSRTLRDDVVRRADLLRYFDYRSAEAARGRLFGMTKIFSGDTITILVRDKDAAMAARIANAYVGALENLQESMASTQADLQRKFFEQQLQKEKDALAAAEGDLERTQLGLGIVEAGTQTQIGLGAIASTRAQITGLQVQLASLLQGSTEQNPEVQRLRSQIGQLQAQERQLESGSGGGAGVGAASPAGRMPRANLEYARKQREVRYHESLVSSLANHYETLRMGAGTTNNTFDVIDPAIVPEFPTWPPRHMFFMAAAGGSLLLGVLTIALQLLTRRILADPVQRTHLYSIKQNVRWRR